MPRKSRKRAPRSPSIASSTTLRRSGGRSYQAHRDWLLGLHGAVCAYCGKNMTSDEVTLDHVRPRKGQTAYDRPDNLVLACPPCNSAKADMPFLAFLLARRSRGVYLLHYGDHLSDVAILEKVGHPVVVGDSASMLELASQREWRVLAWGA